ncbi:hypothetical protein CONLIGDRAFT_699045 [Coniochaeta ligniaria NRRL 30616]|uniref:Uncharacterized protein n=1 Tax=Coniochaeta ligniaria NRRL 30616 TaxID=1408157 RepID=A0A1J7IXB9_9PEZI|nr:hypothetical protein CONLIGDRAFT_699045 [Coniochaeta ligniaria NRRL 30616]
MANRVAYFFYAPTWDFTPGGPIKLGNVLASVKTPELPLYTAQLPAENELFSTEKRQVEFSYEKLREGKFSIVTRFMSFLGIGFDVGTSGSRSSEENLAFDRLETTQFFPREEYLQKCVEAGIVRRFLEKSRYRKPIYIITGLKIVKGAKAKTLSTSSLGGNLGVDVDGTVWSGGAVPVGGGPEISGSMSRTRGTSWEESSDFVLAYRVQKVKVSKEGTVKNDEAYTTGAMLGHDVVVMETSEGDLLSVEDVDVSLEGDGFVAKEVMDGEELVLCAEPADSNSEESGHS